MQLISNSKPLDNNCAVYDPSLKYRWSARSCPDKLRFICQHKMPKVSEANRYKIYNRWNETYPNQLANEVVLEVIDRRGKDHRYVQMNIRAFDTLGNCKAKNIRVGCVVYMVKC